MDQEIIGNSSPWYPTALMIKIHNVTGKKYFCKTTRLNELESYKGSGTVWKRYLKVFGDDVRTEVLGIYYDKKICMETALKFSKENGKFVD